MDNPEITFFGVTNFRNSLKKFGIKTDDRRRHMYLVGKTGMGKSTILEMFWPLSAVTIDWVFFDHWLTVTQVMGAVLLLIAILRVTKRATEIAVEAT